MATVKGRGWPESRPPRVTEAQYDSRCPECEEEILEGDQIYWSEWHGMYVCKPCGGSGC